MEQQRKTCYVAYLGRIAYDDALNLQMSLCQLKQQGIEEDFVLLLEHPPTVTMGRTGSWQNLKVPKDKLAEFGVQAYDTDRGGDITFHGPGQLVGYPILRLESGERDVHLYMRNLEQVLIQTLDAFRIPAGRKKGLTGVWCGDSKIAALGVHFSRWITRHGFALNVGTDLSFFDLIVPCGIREKGVTSMETLLQRRVPLAVVAECVSEQFGGIFRRNIVRLSLQALRAKMGEAVGTVSSSAGAS